MIIAMSAQFHIQLHPLLVIFSGWKLLERERAASSSPRRRRSSKKKRKEKKKNPHQTFSLLSLSFTSLHYKQKFFVFVLLLGNRCHNRQTNRLKNISRHWPLVTGLQLRIFSHAPAYMKCCDGFLRSLFMAFCTWTEFLTLKWPYNLNF